MAPTTPKTNFRTFDVQARLLRAIVAAHPEVKWNYKDIVKSYGSDLNETKLGHRMRHLKTQAEIIRRGLKAGCDPKDMPTEANFPKDQNKIDENICKYFGESTPDGIQFQFRTIKKDAASLRAAAESGKDPTTALSMNPSTPSSRASAKSTPTTGRSRATPKSTSRKKIASTPLKREFSDSEEEDSEEVDYKARDLTPTPTARPVSKRQKSGSAAFDMTSESSEDVFTPASQSFPAGSQIDSKATLSQSFYETESFDSGNSMNSTLLAPEDVHKYHQDLCNFEI